MKSQAAMGFTYRLRITHTDGRVEESEDHNLIPIEGQNHMMGVSFKSVAQVATWYLSVFEGNYIPTLDDKAATYAANGVLMSIAPFSSPKILEIGAKLELIAGNALTSA